MYKSVTLYQQLQEKNNLRLFSLMVVVDNYQIQSILDPLYFSFNCNPYSPCFYSVVDRCPGEHSGRQHRHLDGAGGNDRHRQGVCSKNEHFFNFLRLLFMCSLSNHQRWLCKQSLSRLFDLILWVCLLHISVLLFLYCPRGHSSSALSQTCSFYS